MRSLMALGVAALVGAVLASLATVPPVIFLNLCCGLGWITAGLIAAFLYTRLATNGGLLGSLLAGVGASGLCAVSLLLGAGVGASVVSQGLVDALQVVELPAEPLTLEQIVTLAENIRAGQEGAAEVGIKRDPGAQPSPEGTPPTPGDAADRVIERYRSATPEERAQVEELVAMIDSGARRLRSGDKAPVFQLATMLALLLAVPIAMFVAFGALVGGLLFAGGGDPGEEIVQPPPEAG